VPGENQGGNGMEKQIVKLVNKLQKIAKENGVTIQIEGSLYNKNGNVKIFKVTDHEQDITTKYIDGIEFLYSKVAKYPEEGEQE